MLNDQIIILNTQLPILLVFQLPKHNLARFMLVTRQHEKAITEQFVAQMKSLNILWDNSTAEARCNNILKRLTAVIPETFKAPEKIYILDTPEINACCLPDGTIIVFRGLLEKHNDDELAWVIAHELGHGVAHHSAEMLSKAMIQELAIDSFIDKDSGLLKIAGTHIAAFITNLKEVSGENSMFKIIKQFQSLGLKLPGTTELEILMLLAGKKRALRLIVNADEYEKSLTLAKLLQLEFHVSSKRVAVVSTPGTGDEYVDYVSDAPEDSKYLICFAKEKKDAEYCAKFETMSTDESKLSLNKFLNYPLCCVTSFLERTPHEDWIEPFLRNTCSCFLSFSLFL